VKECYWLLADISYISRERQLSKYTEMVEMSEKVEMIRGFAEISFDRFDRSIKDLSEKEIDWRPIEEANSIRWILTHLSQQWNVGIPKVLKGDEKYKPKGWPEDYVGNESLSLEKIMGDMKKGKNTVMKGLEEMSPADLEAEIPLWGGRRKREFGLLMFMSEILHHEGQIIYLRGAIGRRRQTDKHFLT